VPLRLAEPYGAAGRRRAAVPLPQAGGCSPLRKSSAPRWPISAGSPASAAGSALSRRKCSEWLLPSNRRSIFRGAAGTCQGRAFGASVLRTADP